MDICSYRRAETLAKQNLTSWRTAQAHYPVTFAALGFPIQVESTADLLQLTDMFQEGRADAYQAECGGLSETDFEDLCAHLAGFCRFAGRTWHIDRVPLPLDNMLAAWALFGKLRRWNPKFESLLEIGPGSGYLSWFMRTHEGLSCYNQIEATESLYVLQGLVNSWCFGGSAIENAISGPRIEGDGVVMPYTLARCQHHPWWATTLSGSADIITSNANLREFSPAALEQYAKLTGDTLAPDGALIVQCLGDGAISKAQALDALGRAGLQLAFAGGPGVDHRKFAVGNYLFTRKGLDGAAGRAAQVYSQQTGDRRIYTRAEFETRVTEMVAA